MASHFSLDLYFQHVQPIYPLFRNRLSSDQHRRAQDVSPRLRMAIYAVSSRFASLDAVKCPVTPAAFAKRAASLRQTSDLTIDEIKASFLLCVHEISTSLSWDSVAEIARVTRMADLYYALRLRGKTHNNAVKQSRDSNSEGLEDCPQPNGTNDAMDMEEWKSVWWSIYSLDTCCSALA